MAMRRRAKTVGAEDVSSSSTAATSQRWANDPAAMKRKSSSNEHRSRGGVPNWAFLPLVFVALWIESQFVSWGNNVLMRDTEQAGIP